MAGVLRQCPVPLVSLVVSLLVGWVGAGELLHNGGLESMSGWQCYYGHCTVSSDHHCGAHSIKVTSSSSGHSAGVTQSFNVTGDFYYTAKASVKLLSDLHGKLGQELHLTIDFTTTGNHHTYTGIATYPMARKADGWIILQGTFVAPHSVKAASFRIVSPDPSVDYLIDCASITNIWRGTGWRAASDKTIRELRQSDIHVNVATSGHIDQHNLEIQVLQKKKSFPLGTVVNCWSYEDAAKQKYRDFIHHHFNWAVLESSLKWKHLEPTQGHYSFDRPHRVVDALRKKGIKVRGHNLMWSTDVQVQSWIKQLSGDTLKSTVQHHITQTMNKTHGTLQHWDVNNENLHGFWYQERLHDLSYELEPYRIAHHNDPHMKLFLNEYDVAAHGRLTGAYIAQANRLKKANVGLYGLGVQCHFYDEEYPDPYLIKSRLDMLHAQTGLPIWVTEFNIVAADENKRADFIEAAMRAFYGHPAVQGVLLWGFWDQSHSRGPHAAMVKGDNLQMTAAGHRFLDLWENQWMTDETHVLSKSGSHFTVPGFHGDYEVHVRYQGKDLGHLKQTFTLGKSAHTVNLNVHA